MACNQQSVGRPTRTSVCILADSVCLAGCVLVGCGCNGAGLGMGWMMIDAERRRAGAAGTCVFPLHGRACCPASRVAAAADNKEMHICAPLTPLVAALPRIRMLDFRGVHVDKPAAPYWTQVHPPTPARLAVTPTCLHASATIVLRVPGCVCVCVSARACVCARACVHARAYLPAVGVAGSLHVQQLWRHCVRH